MLAERTGRVSSLDFGRRRLSAAFFLRAPRAALTPPPAPFARPPSSGGENGTPKPWRTEGLPKPPKEKKPRWSLFALAAIGYAIVFAILTVQDRLSAPQQVPYTEFRQQVVSRNVSEVFSRGDSIQGVLKKAVPVPGETTTTYERFTTERPTFANDDLLGELRKGAIYTFPFSYRGGLDPDVGFLLANPEGTPFLAVGRKTRLQFVSLPELADPDVEADLDEESDDDDSMDFGMM